MAWQSNRESPAPPPQEPHLPLQSLLLEERIEEMFKGNQELAGKLHALDGAGGKEQRGWQGSQESPAPTPQELHLLSPSLSLEEQIGELAKCTWKMVEEAHGRISERRRGLRDGKSK